MYYTSHILLGMLKQETSGSPINPDWHEHIALWLITSHLAFRPQEPGHGSLHFLFIQAKRGVHSALTEHSGRHLGGTPIKSGKQVQTDCPFTTRHSLFGPHGDGLQGLLIASWVSKKQVFEFIKYYYIVYKYSKVGIITYPFVLVYKT